MSKKKKGLIESLKSLLGLDQKPEYMGAMCHETHMPLWEVMKCDLCGCAGHERRIPSSVQGDERTLEYESAGLRDFSGTYGCRQCGWSLVLV